jgi:C4-dicarboxylate transporter DctM subunit
MITLLVTAAALLLLLIGTPVFVVICGLALYLFSSSGIDLSAVVIEIHRLATTPVLVAIPLFTFAGYLLSESGAPRRLIRLADALLGWLPGGLAVIALLTCAIFTALTGATGLTIIALGGILLPAMSRGKYPESFSLGLLTTSGTLGLLFPPSLPLIVYAIVAKVGIGELFVAGLLPGALLVVVLSAYSIFVAARLRVPRKTFRTGELVAAVGGCIWELPLPFVVLGGIYTGYFAVSEAAAITAMYVFVVEVLVLRDIRWGVLPELIKQSMVLVGGVLIILGAAMGLTNYLIDAEIPMQMLAFFQAHIDSRLVFLVVLNLFLLAVGCTMGIFSALVVVVPLIAPIAQAYAIDPGNRCFHPTPGHQSFHRRPALRPAGAQTLRGLPAFRRPSARRPRPDHLLALAEPIPGSLTRSNPKESVHAKTIARVSQRRAGQPAAGRRRQYRCGCRTADPGPAVADFGAARRPCESGRRFGARPGRRPHPGPPAEGLCPGPGHPQGPHPVGRTHGETPGPAGEPGAGDRQFLLHV